MTLRPPETSPQRFFLTAAGIKLQEVVVTLRPQALGGRILWPDAHVDLVLMAPEPKEHRGPVLFSPGLQWRPEVTCPLAGPAVRVRLAPTALPVVAALVAAPPNQAFRAVLTALDGADALGAAEATVDWLTPLLETPSPSPLDTASTHLLKAASRVALAELEDLTGVPERALQRLFQNHLGCTLSGFQRLIRFERTLMALAAQPRPALATLALDAGFSDQAHLTREVRAFTGRTPLALWREVRTPDLFKTGARP